MGPTASGKTAIALELATHLPLEIVSVDSAQVFIGMSVGTAKPDAATLARFPHHLIDLITPEQRYSVARFCTDALNAMADITARGRVPLLVGGTMLYFKALRQGLADLPEADPATRAAIDAEAEHHGWPALHAQLARHDPETAARLKPTDAQRIQRALEVLRLTGQTLGSFFASQKTHVLPYRVLLLGLAPANRAWLHERIAQRFDAMLGAGLIDEVRILRDQYTLDAGLPSMRCVGYRQVWEMLEGRMPPGELRDRGIYATRQFAKRQLTWLNSFEAIERVDCDGDEFSAIVTAKVDAFISQPSAA
jgi:tRNA dimethylallyltransferase